jgi:mono/diheme cytochrome c family protein
MGKRQSLIVAVACCFVAMTGCTDARGREIFVRAGCPQCHGLNGEGRPQGPALKDLSRHWTRTNLASYIENAPAYTAAIPRLKELGKKYGTAMPSFLISQEEREQLAEYLLTLR